MRSPHPALTLFVVFVGSFAGGAVVSSQRPVLAQQSPPNVQTSEVLRVPNGGLSIRTMDNRLLGMFSDQNGNGQLTLFASNGAPSVTLVAGTGGFFGFQGSSAAQLQVRGGSNSVRVSAGGEGALVSVNGNGNLFSLNQASSLTLSSGSSGRSLLATADPNRVEVVGKTSRELFSLGGTDSAKLSLQDGAGTVGFLANGTGAAMVRSGDKILWQVPEGD